MIEVNLWAVLLATISSMIVGSVWYAPSAFGNTWAKLAKINTKTMGKGSAKAIILTFIVSFATAYVLAHMISLTNVYFQKSFLQDALATALWLWIGLTAARFITHDAFERRPFKLTLLNIAHELVTLEVMALIIGLIPR